jgi:hypothetical protein
MGQSTRTDASDFVPLCASFVPWNFWQGFTINSRKTSNFL